MGIGRRWKVGSERTHRRIFRKGYLANSPCNLEDMGARFIHAMNEGDGNGNSEVLDWNRGYSRNLSFEGTPVNRPPHSRGDSRNEGFGGIEPDDTRRRETHTIEFG